MKKIMILMILLIIPLVNSLTLEQKNNLEKTLSAVDIKSDFEKLMNLLNKEGIDLSNEEKIINNINSLAERFDVNLANYPNVKRLEIEFAEEILPKEIKEEVKTKIKVNWIQILPVIFIAILILIVEIYRFKNIEEEIPQGDQLKNYIKEALENGYTKEEIKKILIEHNWDENVIDDVLND